MRLKPALNIDGKLYVGSYKDSHSTLAIKHNIDPPTEKQRGFTTGEYFLSRNQSLSWLKENDIETYRKLHKDAFTGGLHSEHLADAYGIEQTPEAVEIREESLNEGTPEKVDLSDKTAIVYDRGGLSIYCAEKLAQSYGTVNLYIADADPYPTSQKYQIGMGLPKVKRIHEFWKYVDKADIIYFFDVYDLELQHWLREKGYIVYGCGRGGQIEIDKIKFLETLEELGLPCPKTYLAEGMDDLIAYLEENDGETLFLKNLHRGDFESRKFTSMAQSRPFLDDLKKRLGAACDTLQVLVQHKIDAACEVGYDGFEIDGIALENCMCGYEIKDKGLIGRVFKQTPEIVKGINDAFAPVFKKLGFRGNYSTELRITKDGTPFYIDATARTPSPPGEGIVEIYENWAEATWQIANGTIPVLKEKAKYLVVIILTSGWYDCHELHVKFPKKYKDNIKLKNHTIRDGEYYCIPNGNGEFFGAIITYNDKLDNAIKECCEIAESIEADEFSFDKGIFDEAQEQIKSGETFGIKF